MHKMSTSSSKSKRFVSVFDRLGPGTDEPVSGSSSRRLPAEKHHSLSSPEQLTPRERKSSGGHSEQLGYREGRPHSLEHTQESDSDERFERRKSQSKGHKSGTKRRHRSSSESSDSGRESNKRQKRDSENIRRSKHSFETDPKRRHHDKKDKLIGSASVEVNKTRSHSKDVTTQHMSGGYKRRRDDGHSESRYGDRKRRHDDDLSPYEYKKPRLSEASPHRVKGEPADHKKRYDPRDGRHPRSYTPEVTPSGRKTQEHQSPSKSTDKKPKKEVETEGTSETLKALDWDYLGSYTQRQTAKLDHSRPRSALERFTPGALFARVGVSRSLAGPNYANIVSAVSTHLQREGDLFENDVIGVVRVREEENMFKTGEYRRALTTSDDLQIRRKLREQTESEFLPRLDGRGSWESQLYSTGVALYQSLGKRSSGKPVYRVQDSRVGELLVAR